MLRFIFTLAIILNYKSRVKKHYSPDTIISDLFDEDLNEIDFIKSLSELELIYGFEIPDELYDRTDLTLGNIAEALSQLPVISDGQYSEFFDIKFTSIKLTKTYIELETKTDAKSIRELEEINQQFEKLDDRLNIVLGNTLVNY